jgi:hypothetical protein
MTSVRRLLVVMLARPRFEDLTAKALREGGNQPRPTRRYTMVKILVPAVVGEKSP